MALATFFLNKIESLFHALVTDGDKSCSTRYFNKNGMIAYKRDSVNNLSVLSYNFLTNDSKKNKRKNLLLRKSLILTASLLQIKKLQHMLVK